MKKIILSLSIIFASLFIFTNVSALEIAKSGDDITVEGNYSSLRVIAGNKVDNKSTNDGLSFIAASDLLLEGESTYGFYAGRNVTVKEKINKDLFIAGSNITFNSSVIGRDLYLGGSNVKLNDTKIERNANISAGIVELSNVIVGGDVYINAEKIIINENTEINGDLNYSSNAIIIGLDKANINDVKTHMEKEPKKISMYESFTNFVISYIGEFILLIIILLMLPTFKEELDVEDLDFSNILKNTGIGFTILIMVPILCIIGMATIILIPVSILTFICYFIAIYLSFLFVSYVIGNLVTTKLFQMDNIYLKASVGLLIGKVIARIPIIGGLIVFIMILFGIGHYIKLFKK